jgi:hypothetical protein
MTYQHDQSLHASVSVQGRHGIIQQDRSSPGAWGLTRDNVCCLQKDANPEDPQH